MTAARARIRPASFDDLKRFYGRTTPWRVQAVVVEQETGRVLGIGGVEHQPAGLKAFMDMADGVDASAHGRVLIAATRRVLALAAAARRPVFALRDQEQPASGNFLTHFGFVPEPGAGNQEIWRWAER